MRLIITVPKLAALSLVVLFGVALSLPTYAGTPIMGLRGKSTMIGKLPMGIGKSKVGFIMLKGVDALNTLSSVKRSGTTTPLKQKSDWMSTIGLASFFERKAKWNTMFTTSTFPIT